MTDQPVSRDEGTCSMCKKVPVSHLALDVAEPTQGWVSYFEEKGILVLPDAAGRPSVPRHVLADLIDEEKRREDRLAEEAAIKAAELVQPVGAGVPAIEDGDAYASMMAAGAVSPAEEFGQWAKPRFLEEALEEGARRQAAEQEAVRRRKERK
jgi:hypothetical protein